MSGPQNLDRMTTIYGPITWDVYARLDQSLDPRGPDQLYDLAAPLISEGGTVLDVGCRDAAHLIELARRHPTIRGVGVEPVAIHVERAKRALAAAPDGVAERISIHHGVVQELPVPDASIDFVWCRDVLVQVDDLGAGLSEVHRAMSASARLLAYSSFATDRLDGVDLEMMRRHLGWLEANVRRPAMERAFIEAGFSIESVYDVGTEWREYAEERTQPTSKSLLRLSRLRRQREDIVAWRGQAIYDHIEANLHYEAFLMLGKLEPTVHVLRKAG
ncbi:MAG TPA: class I SAM-dependent methyltransferase [Acidimicrobiales bacterium]|nr:class I SAM-dependent methyltransferase [Acidimicrobiales bacterium]